MLGEKKCCVGYEIGCKCGKVVYKGETKKRFKERKKKYEDRERLTRTDIANENESRAQERMGKLDAGLTRHAVMNCEAGIDWKNAKIVYQESDDRKRKIRESIETMKEDLKGERNTLNRCVVLHEGYRPVLQSLIERKAKEEKKWRERIKNRTAVQGNAAQSADSRERVTAGEAAVEAVDLE